MSPDLIPPRYRRHRPDNAPASWGLCYPVCEALYHLWGKKHGYKPAYVRYTINNFKATHWVLIKKVLHASPTHTAHMILDPTSDQFSPCERPDYRELVPTGFLTKRPSKRARILMRGKHAKV